MSVGPVILPELTWEPTKACASRNGYAVTRVVVHRWGVAYTTPQDELASYRGVINFFMDPAHQASAHVVFPGSAFPGHATQMVAWSDRAWAEAEFNTTSDDIESADAIWLGHDPRGMQVLARMVAKRLHDRQIPPRWSTERGFCRHADLGPKGGGHTQCPTTDLHLWRVFTAMVQHEFTRAGFKLVWGV